MAGHLIESVFEPADVRRMYGLQTEEKLKQIICVYMLQHDNMNMDRSCFQARGFELASWTAVSI